ncbi:hypothetical protein Hypma_009804 [Hypsizygus marmoreus]|uniref:Uncharacterized protein n=1 Tax=Hypsizygus marmoreus TaxID=39966 RepID=A0A369JNN5_HYPMA|nr:hypothetical protein Hypma_009804 [Hypsizygus marmoreus]
MHWRWNPSGFGRGLARRDDAVTRPMIQLQSQPVLSMPEYPEIRGFVEVLTKNHGSAWLEETIPYIPPRSEECQSHDVPYPTTTTGDSTLPASVSDDSSDGWLVIDDSIGEEEETSKEGNLDDMLGLEQASDNDDDSGDNGVQDNGVPLVLLPFMKKVGPLDGGHLSQAGQSSRTSDSETFSLEINPQMFSTGSKGKAYTTLTVDHRDFTDGAIPGPERQKQVSAVAWSRSQNQPWFYLLNNNHALLIHFGLEAHLMCVPISLYRKIVAHDIPGPNQDSEKANLIRSFVLPDKTIVPGSSPVRPRTINIFAAFVSNKHAWIICDFSRLVRLHVVSRNDVWTQDDLQPSSPGWSKLWEPFRCGPDWLLEKGDAEKHLDTWQTSVLNQHAEHEKRWRAWKAKSDLQAIFKFFPSATGKTFDPSTHGPHRNLGQEPLPPTRCLIKDMGRNSCLAFSGFGRHTANDFLYRLGLFPGTPCYEICKDPDAYRKLKEGIHAYFSEFQSSRFLKRVSSTTNSQNPFAFNKKSHKDYLSSHIDVFRRVSVLMKKDTYNAYAKQGLFDESHTIGEPYPEEKVQLCKNDSKWVDVQFYQTPLRAYSVVLAKPPRHWLTASRVPVEHDIGCFSYSTTIGCAQFRERVLNRVDPSKVDSSMLAKQGKPVKVYTGKRGRPPNKLQTKKQVKEDKSRQGRRPKQKHASAIPPGISQPVEPSPVEPNNGPDSTCTSAPSLPDPPPPSILLVPEKQSRPRASLYTGSDPDPVDRRKPTNQQSKLTMDAITSSKGSSSLIASNTIYTSKTHKRKFPPMDDSLPTATDSGHDTRKGPKASSSAGVQDSTQPKPKKPKIPNTRASIRNAHRRRSSRSNDDSDKEDDDFQPTNMPAGSTDNRRETIRKQRIESEQTRCDELRDGYARAQGDPSPVEPEVKQGLFARPWEQFENRLKTAEAEVHRLCNVNEALMLSMTRHAVAASIAPASF